MKTIAFLIFPDFQILDTTGPLAAFEMPARLTAPSPYRLEIIAKDAGPVASSSRAQVIARGWDEVGPVDTLVVAGGQGTRGAATDPDTIAFIQAAAVTSRRVASVCSGAFILAAAGLLDGRRATTHWGQTRYFETLFPKVKVEPDRIYTHDGPIWTSAGVTAGIDLALALIADDLGDAAARMTAQELVVYHRRPGGQSQFSALLDIEPVDGRFAALLGWARENLAQPLTVEDLATRANMSPRNFARAFRAQTGITPAKAVEQLRLEAARSRVEATGEPIDQIALKCGFRDPERMRRAFVRSLGQPPQSIRRSARRAAG